MHLVKWITNLMLSVHQNGSDVKDLIHRRGQQIHGVHKKVPESAALFLKMGLAQHSPAPFSFLQETTLS